MSEIQAKITAMWDRASARYDTFTGHGLNTERERRAWRTALNARLPAPPADVLDLGTGTGVMALLLAEMGYTVRGIDLSAAMLARAREKAAGAAAVVKFDLGDAADPPGAPETYDVIFNRHLIHMLIDPSRALENWYRLLRPGGCVVVVDGLWGRDPEDRIDETIQAALPLRAPETTLDDVRRVVEGAGFIDVIVGDLADIDRIERELSTGPDATDIPHFVVTGRKPA